MNWNEYFIDMAELISTKSKDNSTKVGCVIVGQDNGVLSTGFNGFPRGVTETEEEWVKKVSYWDQGELVKPVPGSFDRWGRPQKYSWVEHAERNAVYYAARHGIALNGAKAYLNWDPRPCADCTRAFIQAGIVEIIGPNIPFTGKGSGVNYSLEYADIMCKEAGVKMTPVEYNPKKTKGCKCTTCVCK